MKIYFILFSFFCLVSCNLFEDEISFTTIDDPDKTKYSIVILDSVNIIEGAKYINNTITEKFKFVYDSVRTEKWTFNKNDEIVAKRYYIFEPDNYVIKYDSNYIGGTLKIDTLKVNKNSFLKRKNAAVTIDSVFGNDSTLVIISQYSYNDDFLIEFRTFEYTVNGLHRKERFSKLFYDGDKNLIKVNYEVDDGMCSDQMQYASYLNLVDIQRFENKLLGGFSTNLVQNAYWEKGCDVEAHKVKPSSRYIYELDASGYVIQIKEEFTPEYKEYVGTQVERVTKYVEYEYLFVK